MTRATLIVIVAIVVVQTGWSALTTSAVLDEVTYLDVGRALYLHGDASRLSALGIAPLPIVLWYGIPALVAPEQFTRAIALARSAAIALAAVPLVLVVYYWLAMEIDARAGAVGAALVALSPNVVAHGALATTDVLATGCSLAALAALAQYADRPTRPTFALLAGTTSLAVASKYSAIALFIVLAVVLLTRFPSRIRGVFAAIGVIVATAFVFVWALHRFAFVPAGFPSIEHVNVPAPVAGVLFQLKHQREGHPAFLMGMHSGTGWWYFIPAALSMKSTSVELVALVAATVISVLPRRDVTTSELVWRTAFLVFGALALVGRVDIGIRYVLILIPLAVLIVTTWMCRTFARPRIVVAVSAVALAIQCVSAATIAPHYLSYFNALAGGPANGFRYLADSNIDWGQDLPALRAAFERVGARRPLLSYFGTAPLNAYGVTADPWLSGDQPELQPWDWVAISVTNLNGVYLPGDPFAPFRPVEPSTRAGYSIFLYSTARADVQRAIADASARLPWSTGIR